MAVLAFPPSECCRILVSLESLYGMCPPFVLLPPLQAHHYHALTIRPFCCLISTCKPRLVQLTFFWPACRREWWGERTPEFADASAEGEKASVNVGSFFQPGSISLCLRSSLASSQIHKILQQKDHQRYVSGILNKYITNHFSVITRLASTKLSQSSLISAIDGPSPKSWEGPNKMDTFSKSQYTGYDIIGLRTNQACNQRGCWSSRGYALLLALHRLHKLSTHWGSHCRTDTHLDFLVY